MTSSSRAARRAARRDKGKIKGLPEGIPKSTSWRKAGIMGTVRNQEDRVCCWAFSVAGGLEGQYRRHNREDPIQLSVQELVDGVKEDFEEPKEFDKYCCYLAPIIDGYTWVKKKGLLSEESRPWTGSAETDKPKAKGWNGIKIGGYRRVQPNEQEILKALALRPLSAGIAYNNKLRFLGKGIWDGELVQLNEKGKCSYHAIVLTGYKTENGQNIYEFKNSYGTGWGDEGYGKVLRDSSRKEIKFPLVKNVFYGTDIVRVYDGK